MRGSPLLRLSLLPFAAVGCPRTLELAADAPTYSGSTTIADSVLPGLIEGFERASGAKFGKVEEVGSADGFADLMRGKVSLAGVSRALEPTELAQKPFSEVIGYDAMAILVHDDNPVAGLTKAQLRGIFTGRIANWQEVGGKDQPIEVVTETLGHHGTIKFLQTAALEGDDPSPARTFESSVDCVRYVARAPNHNAVTNASLSFLLPHTRAVPIDGVAPDLPAVKDGTYPLARPLLLVARPNPQGHTKEFLDFAISQTGQSIISQVFVTSLAQ